MKTKTAKCENCLPDGGAVFEATVDYYDRTADDQPVPKWECRNCGHTTPRRVNNQNPEKPNARQQRIIDAISARFGGTVEVEMIGRKAWCTFENDERKWYNGMLMAGSIGAKGKLDLRLYNGLGEPTKITDTIGLKVYVGRTQEEIEDDERQHEWARTWLERTRQ